MSLSLIFLIIIITIILNLEIQSYIANFRKLYIPEESVWIKALQNYYDGVILYDGIDT